MYGSAPQDIEQLLLTVPPNRPPELQIPGLSSNTKINHYFTSLLPEIKIGIFTYFLHNDMDSVNLPRYPDSNSIVTRSSPQPFEQRGSAARQADRLIYQYSKFLLVHSELLLKEFNYFTRQLEKYSYDNYPHLSQLIPM